MTYFLLISFRSKKTNRWLTYKVHSWYQTFREATEAGDELLNKNPCNSLRVKIENYNF